jgi:uncharacterized protein YndB with AHSA1/START domain
MWMDAKHLSQWWGPKGFTNVIHEFNARPGGAIRLDMCAPDGAVYPMSGTFEEIAPPERIVFRSAALDANGQPMFEMLNTISFAAEGNKTAISAKVHALYATAAAAPYLKGAEMGWNQQFDRLAEYVTSPRGSLLKDQVGKGRFDIQNEFAIARTFDAPRDLVWKAWTEPERLAQWWGPKGFTCDTKKLELRPGGIFHYCMRAANGHEMWGKFVYKEIAPPERLVFVNSFSDAEGNTVRSPFSASWPLEIQNTLTLTEQDGRTTISLRGAPVNASAEEMQTFTSFFKSMEQGFTGTFDQLAEYLNRA